MGESIRPNHPLSNKALVVKKCRCASVRKSKTPGKSILTIVNEDSEGEGKDLELFELEVDSKRSISYFSVKFDVLLVPRGK